MKALYGIVVFLFIGTFQLRAQDLQYEQKRYGQLDGLLSQRVHSIYQDSLGYLILGTDNGVFLFDGHDFSRPPYHDLIESKRIEAIHGIGGNSYILLAGSPNAAYFIENNTVKKVQAFQGMRNVEKVYTPDPEKNNIYYKRKTKIFRVPLRGTDPPTELFDYHDDIVAFTVDAFGGFYIWNRRKQIVYVVDGKIQNQTPLSNTNVVWKFLNHQNGTTLVWSQDSILVLKKGAVLSKTYHKTTPQLVVRNVGFFPNGHVWFAEDGTDLFEYYEGQVSGHTERFAMEERAITCAYKDVNNTYWIGTERNGLLRVRLSDTKLISGSQGLKVTTMAHGNGELLVGTSDGIFKYNKGVFNRLSLNDDYRIGQLDVFEKNYTYQIAYVQNHWLISSMRPQSGLSKGIETAKVLGKTAFIKNAPSQHLEGNVLLTGSWGRFSAFEIKNGIPENRQSYYASLGRTNELIPLSENLTVAVCDRRLLICKINGTSKIDTSTLLGTNILSTDLTYNDVEVQGNDWYLATTVGVFKATFNPENQQLEQIEQISFTESTCLRWVGQSLWIGGSSGLLQYTNGNLIPFLINTPYGDPDVLYIEYNEDNSKLLIGTVNGLFQIDPFSKALIDKQLKIGAPSLILDGSVVQENVQSIELSHDQNTFDIQVPVLNFLHPLKAEVMYSIDDGASERGNSGVIRFNSLEANTYEIKLWGEAANGQKTTEKHIRIEVLRPFWKRTWFLISAILFILSVSAIALYARSRQLKNRALRDRETQQLVNELEKKALNLSLNPHFLFNSLNSIQSKISTFKDEDLVNYIADFSSLMRKVLINSDQSFIGLSEELAQLELYLKMEQRRHPNKIDYSIEVSDQVREQELEIPPMLLQPFVENSILHGILPSKNKGVIRIEAFIKDRFLHLLITDNGVGLKGNEHKQQHESKGLDITRKRILLQHPQNIVTVGDICALNTGTGVQVEIKLWLDN